MANAKISQLTALTTPDPGDLLAIVDDPGGTPVTKKITVETLLATLGQSLSLEATVSPVTLTGGDDGFGDSALIVSVGADDYMGVILDAALQADVYFPPTGTISFDQLGFFFLSSGDECMRLEADSWLVAQDTNAATLAIGARDTDTHSRAVFATLTSGSTPTAVISQPSGGTLAIVPPSTDPHVVGAIWNNAGTLAISAG